MSDIHYQRAELQKQVDQLKSRESKGEKLPDETMHEVRTGVQMRNVLPLGEIMRGLVPKLEEIRATCKSFEEDIVEKIQLLEKQYCEEHPSVEVLVNQNETIKHSWQKQHLFVVYDDCLECKRVEEELEQREFWIRRGVPWKVLHSTFDNYKAECEAKQNAVSKFKRQLKKGKGFIFAIGSVGTGKTHLAVATMKVLGGRFITMHDLVAELRATYQNHDEKFLTKYQEAKILVVDELSKDVYDPTLNKGLDIPPLLYRVLGYRYDHDLLTVITSNESLDDCLAILGPKLRDRIRENKTIVNFTWESNRKPENSESPRELL